MTDKPTIPQFLERFRAYHAIHSTWGSLHIVLDDGNVKDADVEFCIRYARDKGDAEGAELAHLLSLMSPTQRRRLASIA